MTVTRIQEQFYFNFLNFQISKDIVWAYGLSICEFSIQGCEDNRRYYAEQRCVKSELRGIDPRALWKQLMGNRKVQHNQA
jgi:hypothetical protein